MSFSARSPLSLSYENVHGVYKPADVRSGENIKCSIEVGPKKERLSYTVWRLSPFGVEVIDSNDSPLEVGRATTLHLKVAGKETSYQGIVVASGMETGKRRVAGIRLETTPRAERKGKDVDQRGKTRWQTHRLFYPTGSADNKLRFNDRVFFRVSDISSDGMRLASSLRNKHLHVGAELNAQIQLPSVGEIDCRLRVMRLDVSGGEEDRHQIIGVRFIDTSHRCMELLGQYILQFGGDDKVHPTPKSLAQQGFYVSSIADALDYDIVRTNEEYQQVLHLRSLAFRGVEGLGFEATPEEMADVFDSRARILICRYRGQVVATTRLCFHGPGENFEEEKYIRQVKNFPPRELVVEAGRAAAHPDFRGSDLFLNIFRYVMLLTLQSGRRWIVQATYTELLPVYEKVGFRQTGVHPTHPQFPGKELHLLLGDCQSVLEGRVGNLLTWNALVPDIRHLIENNEHVKLSWLNRKRLSVYQALTPLYRFYEKKKIDRRMRRNKLR